MGDITVNVIVEPWFLELTKGLAALVSQLKPQGMYASAGVDVVSAALNAAVPHAISTRTV